MTVVPNAPSKRTARRRLVRLFERNGYVRQPNARRLAKEGAQHYKKGSEVRLLAQTDKEAIQIRDALNVLGFTSGSSFIKSRQLCIPVYGHKQVARFMAMVGVQAA